MHYFFIGLLGMISILGLTFIIERGLALRRNKVLPPEVEDAIDSFQMNHDLAYVEEVCRSRPSALSRLVLLAAQHRHWTKSDNTETLQTKARHEVMQLERWLVMLEIIVGVAPLLGLIGTIFGLIQLFQGMGPEAASAGNTQVASGIALALQATFMGLIAAIPSLVAWSYFNKKVDTLAIEMETQCDLFLRSLYRETEGHSQKIKTARPVA